MLLDTRLTRRAITVPADASIRTAAHTMSNEAVGCLVAVDGDGRAVGVLTDRDLALRVVGRTCAIDTLAVSDVMSPELVSVTANDSLETIVSRMKTRGVRRVPVLDDGKAVAMVALDDVLRLLASELHDIGTEARQRYRHADLAARYEHVRESAEHGLEEIGHRLSFANYFVRKSFIDELDALRDRLRKVTGTVSGQSPRGE